MKPISVKLLGISFLLGLLAFSIVLSGCSGGGNTTASATGGSASVSVSMSSASGFPAGTTFSTATTAGMVSSAPASTTFDNVWVTVVKIALIPSTGPENPDQDGELEEINESSEEGNGGKSGFVTFVLPAPVTFDLLNPPSDTQLAKFVNKASGIPAGEYSKIRVYYDSVVGQEPDGTLIPFHQTAHYHFDVHFVGGNLVIPVSTDPEHGIRFYSISIDVVGLKIQQAGKSDNYLMRPQVFATVAPLKYIVSGQAWNVDPEAGTFDILTGGETISAAYGGGTLWMYIDNAVPAFAWGNVGSFLGPKGLQNSAIVDVIGSFSPGTVLDADEVDVTFPDAKTGKVLVGWNPDNTFTLRTTFDNVTPKPTRTTAYYDNSADTTFPQLPDGDQAIVDNVSVTARGYAVTGGIEAYWISIGTAGP